jgi:hypothetical protein
MKSLFGTPEADGIVPAIRAAGTGRIDPATIATWPLASMGCGTRWRTSSADPAWCVGVTSFVTRNGVNQSGFRHLVGPAL